MSETSDSTAAALRTLSGRRIYFGHQSVGRNILSGLGAILSTNGDTSLHVVESADPTAHTGSVLMHFAVGRNEDPASKNEAFKRVLNARRAPDGAIAVLKYCYIDVNAETDIANVFRGYAETVAEVKRNHPDITLVHVTMPLTTDARGMKASVKRLLGRPTAREVNVKRNWFNRKLRETYPGEPLFDLAALESTWPDGRRESVLVDGVEVFALVPAYTDDGGHLSKDAQVHVAQALVRTLASVSPRP